MWSKITGEMSKLRRKVWGTITGKWSSAYKLDSSTVNYEMARELYNNTHDDYKLGAWVAKPVINTTVGYMGVPSFMSEDEHAQLVLDTFMRQNTSKAQQAQLDALKYGDCVIWLTREDEDAKKELYPELKKGARLIFNIMPPESIVKEELKRDPITNEVTEWVFRVKQEWIDERGTKKRCTITERINKDFRVREIEGDNPGLFEGNREEKPNQWGFLPIVVLSNDKDSGALFGRSELEPLEPYMKAYHDVMLHAMQGSKLHSTPKLKLRVKNVADFMKVNFGITDIAKFAKEGKSINFEGKELIMLADETDEAEFIEVKSATGDAKVLLKLLFFCMVDVSETPEFAFGTHTPSSQASVKEQTPVLVRKIQRKREQFADSWELLARMILAMNTTPTGQKFSTHATEITWEEIDPRDEKDTVEIIKTLVEGLATAINNELISREAAIGYLAQYIDTMNSYDGEEGVAGEKERIKNELLERNSVDSGLTKEEQSLIDEALGAGD